VPGIGHSTRLACELALFAEAEGVAGLMINTLYLLTLLSKLSIITMRRWPELLHWANHFQLRPFHLRAVAGGSGWRRSTGWPKGRSW
jgi:hypothetical protein